MPQSVCDSLGGGTRIKAYEAMGMGKAMVSTRVGVEGLPVRNGDHLILADERDQFAGAVMNFWKTLSKETESKEMPDALSRRILVGAR